MMDFQVKSSVEDSVLVVRRRAQLIEAAIPLFCKSGYANTTIKDVATVAGVSPGLVYQYVQDKQDLLFICLLHIVQCNKREIPAALEGVKDPLLRLIRAVEAYTHISATNRKAILLTYRETKSLKPEYISMLKRMELETNALIEACIDECVRIGYLAPVNSQILAYRMVFAVHAWPLKHWRLSKIISLRDYIEECIHICWTTILTPSGKRHYAKLLKPT
jgi:AcrR family transcriptional regulator